MVAGAVLYRGELRVADADAGRYLTLDVATARHPSETVDRLVLRLLALGLFPWPDLAFRPGVCAGDEPDLATRDGDGRITHWVDVGTPALDRLRAAQRRDRHIGVLTHDGLVERWRRQHGGALALDPQWLVWTVDARLVEGLGAALRPRLCWDLTLSGGVLYLAADGVDLTCEPARLTT